MTTVARWRGTTLTPLDWLGLALPTWGTGIRVEEYLEDDHYVVRAELPGIDPAKDVRITHADGALRLEVTRVEEQHDRMRTEFHYGSFVRSIPLPVGAVDKSIAASYEKGILEIRVTIGETADHERVIPVHTVAPNGASNRKI
jgi:HSP20 family protein